MPPTKKFPVKGIVIKNVIVELVLRETEVVSHVERVIVMSNLNKAATVKLKGTIIFYDRTKGFGFVNGSNGQRYHLGFNAITGEWIPVAGDRVEFIVSKRLNKQGQAQSIETIELLSHGDVQDNGKELCPHCGKRVNPRMTFYRGAPCASYCPLCGGKIKQFMKVNNAIFWITVVLICSIFVLIPVSQILS